MGACLGKKSDSDVKPVVPTATAASGTGGAGAGGPGGGAGSTSDKGGGGGDSTMKDQSNSSNRNDGTGLGGGSDEGSSEGRLEFEIIEPHPDVSMHLLNTSEGIRIRDEITRRLVSANEFGELEKILISIKEARKRNPPREMVLKSRGLLDVWYTRAILRELGSYESSSSSESEGEEK